MYKLCLALLVLASALAASAQTNVQTAGGALTSGFSDKALMMTDSPVTFVNVGGTITPATGSVSLQTPVLAAGTLAAGATFGAGGSFVVQITSPSAVTYNGTFQSGATWTKQTLANGTHSYELSGTLIDVVTGETAAFALQTANIGSGNFDTVIAVDYISITLN